MGENYGDEKSLKLDKNELKEYKFSKKALKEFGAVYSVVRLLISPKSAKIGWRYIRSVFLNFFFLQFKQRVGIYKIPVIHVDHPLDRKIPFVPSKVSVYMDFVGLYLRPNTMYLKRFGIKKAVPFCNEWFYILSKVYSEAGSLYRRILSTTERPEYKENKMFRLIHFWDPHLLCVPSIHIAVVVLAVAVFKKQFKKLGFSDAECFQKNTELYNEAVEIAESVLLIKQHSVNCVAAALYMVTKLFPEYFTPNDAVNFINDMFLASDAVSFESSAEIKEYISFMYERFLLEGYSTEDWKEPVINWLSTYEIDMETKK